MPIFGDRDVVTLDGPLRPTRPATSHAQAQDVQILQLLMETEQADYLSLVPAAFHPTNPAVLSITMVRCGESPFGAFSYAHVGVVCRAGVRLRSYLFKTIVDSEAAAAALAGSWGYRTELGQVRIDRGYDEVTGTVVVDGRPILEVAERAPIPLASSDLFFMDFINAALVDGEPRLVQVDPEYLVRTAERGEPIVRSLDAAAWGEPRLRCVHPLVAVYADVDMAFPQVRFLSRTDESALRGTERLDVEVTA